MEQLQKACDTLHWGHPDGIQCLNSTTRQRVATHEAGHALIALRHGHQVPRITILPRDRFWGAVQSSQEEGMALSSRQHVRESINIYLGGLCAEDVMYGDYHSGGGSDLREAKRLVHGALYTNGMGMHGAMAEHKLETMSQHRKQALEDEETQWMREQFDDTKTWLLQHQDTLLMLRDRLLERVEVSGEDLEDIRQSLEHSSKGEV